jgi:hypothetical protein
MKVTAVRPRADSAVRPPAGWVDLYWLPLGAGSHLVSRCGRLYEQASALRDHRRPQPLFHSALELVHDETRYVIEMAPVWSDRTTGRGVVVEGAVGLAVLGRVPLFRYEVRCWSHGRIADRFWAVDSPQRLSADPVLAARLVAQVRRVPAFTWGRDELGAGDMWNSNSLIAWLLGSCGFEVASLSPPRRGRAPGWDAGLALAARLPRAVEAAPVDGGA